jgi:hypothetical protein
MGAGGEIVFASGISVVVIVGSLAMMIVATVSTFAIPAGRR